LCVKSLPPRKTNTSKNGATQQKESKKLIPCKMGFSEKKIPKKNNFI
jgi:hypothetical protein